MLLMLWLFGSPYSYFAVLGMQSSQRVFRKNVCMHSIWQLLLRISGRYIYPALASMPANLIAKSVNPERLQRSKCHQKLACRSRARGD